MNEMKVFTCLSFHDDIFASPAKRMGYLGYRVFVDPLKLGCIQKPLNVLQCAPAAAVRNRFCVTLVLKLQFVLRSRFITPAKKLI